MMMPRMQEVFPDHDMESLQSALITSEFNINRASSSGVTEGCQGVQ